MQENKEQKDPKYGHFFYDLRSVRLKPRQPLLHFFEVICKVFLKKLCKALWVLFEKYLLAKNSFSKNSKKISSKTKVALYKLFPKKLALNAAFFSENSIPEGFFQKIQYLKM